MTARWRDRITIVAAVAISCVTLLLVLGLSDALPGGKGAYRVQLLVPQASSLTSGANVLIAGLPAGRVESIQLRGTSAVVRISIDDEHAPLPADSRFAVRLRTLVGENYIEVYPGKARTPVPDGTTLARRQNIEYVEADQILDTLKGRTRARARELIGGLADGVADRGPQLNRLVEGTAGVITEASPVVRVLDADREQLARIVDDLGIVSRAVGERGTAIRMLARDSRATLRSVANRDVAVRALLSELPATLRQVRETTATAQAVTRQAAPVLLNLAAAVREAQPAVSLLAPAAVEGRAVVAELGRAAPRLRGTLKRLETLAPPATKVFPQVRKVLCQVNPMAKYLRPYARDILTFVNNLGAVTNYYDATGHSARLYSTIGSKSAGIFDSRTAKVVDALLATNAFGRQGGLGYDPFPAPGRNNDLTTGLGVIGPKQVTAPYTRVRAAC